MINLVGLDTRIAGQQIHHKQLGEGGSSWSTRIIDALSMRTKMESFAKVAVAK
jgi:hypothetical protein